MNLSLHTQPSVGSGSNPADATRGVQPHGKLRKAAEEFEGMLIAQMLGQFNLSLTSMSSESEDAGSATLNALAVQTFANAMAARGGFGFAKMLVHQLEPHSR